MTVQDQVKEYMKRKAKDLKGDVRVFLFGSRARGDERSDFDFAIETEATEEEWANWAIDVREHVPTLCGIDLVRIHDSMNRNLREAIKKEGELVYELLGA